MLVLACVISLFVMFGVAVKGAEAKMSTLDDKFAEVNRPPTRILTSDGVELYRVSAENRIPLKFSQIPEHVRNAIIAAEDKRFYQHDGVDPQGLLRAFSTIFKDGHVSQGGSTITMQLAKRLYNGSDKTFNRKMDDIAYAYEIERYLGSKNRILELYMNQVYFGEGAHGIGAAAKVYFNKDVKDLTISDAAILARCVRLPSVQNPIKNLDVALENRDAVLGVMHEEKMISDSQYQDALAEKPKINPNPPSTTASYPAGYGQYVVAHVLHELKDEGLDIKSGGLTIIVTVDSKLQKIAENSVRQRVAEYRAQKVNQGMCVAMDAEGRILCEAGGVDFRKNEYNIVERGSMQPGSGFKPFLYSIALRDGVIRPDQYLSNEPITITRKGSKPWTPQNASRSENRSSYSVMEAISLSVNRPAVHTIMALKPSTLVQAAHDVFGFRSELAPYEPLALGASNVNPLEMAEGYSVFMLRGDRVRPYLISKISGPDGEVIKEFYPQKFTNVLDPEICDQMDNFLSHVVSGGTGHPAQDIPDARGKTGTTNSAKDAWFDGYADGVLAIAWCGNQRLIKGQWTELPMASNVFGGTTAINIWRDVMRVAQKRFGKPAQYGPPTGVTVANITAPKKSEKPPVDPNAPVPDNNLPPEILPTEDPNTGDEIGPDGTIVIPPDEGSPAKKPEDHKPPVKPPTDTLGAPDSLPPANADDIDNPKPKKKPRTPRNSDDNQTVTLEICVDSGLIANPYCNETVTRTFSKRSAPKRICTLHKSGGE